MGKTIINNFIKEDFINALLSLILIFSLIFIFNGCGGSSNSSSESTTGKLTINVKAMYQIQDSVFNAKGDMIKKLSLQNKNNPTGGTVIFGPGASDQVYIRGNDFFGPLGIYEIELIDYKGLMRDSLVTPTEYGFYNINVPIILDVLKPAEISEYREDITKGNVIFDK